MQQYNTACPRNCYSTCSFKVNVENNKIVGIEPQPENLATPEGICIKGLSYVERANSSERILFPMKKVNNLWERISWREAIETIAEKLIRFRDKFGHKSILFYAASGMSGELNSMSAKFWELFGGCSRTYGNNCWPAGLEATRLALGENKHNAPWDLENAKLIIMWGKNPAETNIQEMIFVNKAIEKGAKLVVIDPRRTQTAESAHLYLSLKPATDAAFALGVANCLIKAKKIDHNFINTYVSGFEDFAKRAEKFSPEKVADICGVSSENVTQLADLIANSEATTILCGYGMQRYTNGGQTIRAILALNVITGNIGKKGACWHFANLQSYVFDNVKEPLNYYPKAEGIFRQCISMANIGEDLLDTQNPEIKMIWVERGNPVNQNPNTNTILKAFRALEYRVVVEQFMTDTAKEADIILPAKNMFEQTDIIGSYWNPYIQLKPKVVEPAGEVKTELEIYNLLADKLGVTEEEKRLYIIDYKEESIENYLKNLLAQKSSVSWNELKEKPCLDASYEEIAFSDMVFQTPSGKIELSSQTAETLWNSNKIADYVPLKENRSSEFPFYLLTPNSRYHIHSQFNNLNIIKQFNPKPTVIINAFDAKKHNIKNGDLVRVFNNRGEIKLPAEISLGIREGCISVNNGWWASEGGNVNFLSKGRFTDMGFGTAFHDNVVDIEKIEK